MRRKGSLPMVLGGCRWRGETRLGGGIYHFSGDTLCDAVLRVPLNLLSISILSLLIFFAVVVVF